MLETADAFRERLREEGQFDVFVARRQELIAVGRTKGQAWEIAAGELGWGGSSLQTAVPRECFSGKTSSPVEDVGWAYHNLTTDVGPEDAPGPGAWSMLQFARSHPARFFTTIFTKVMGQIGGGGTTMVTEQDLRILRELSEPGDDDE